MPVVTLKFSLPDEEVEFDSAIRGADYRRVLEDLSNELRSKVKYGVNISNAERKVFDEVRELLFSLVDHYQVTLS